jgi:uncharacterized protein (TIGR02217 family)
MAFHEVRFPANISWGSTGGPGFMTAIIESQDAGHEQRIQRWSAAGKRTWNAKYGIKSPDDISAVLTFDMARRGAAHGFRWKDWSDFTTATNHRGAASNIDTVLGIGDGVTTTFQIQKIYQDSGGTATRNIRKPVAGTTAVALDGVAQASGWTVDTTTGVITFTVAPSIGVVVSAGCQFDVPARFGQALDQRLDINIDAFDAENISDIPIVELLDETEEDEDFWWGGGTDFGQVAGNMSITTLHGRAIAINPTAAINVTLPDYATLLPGGPKFHIANLNTTNAIALKDHLGGAVATIAALGSVTVWLFVDAFAAKYWVAS